MGKDKTTATTTIVPSNAYPILFKFFNDHGMKKCLKALKKETGLKEFDSTNEDLLNIISFYRSHHSNTTTSSTSSSIDETTTTTKKDSKKKDE